MGQTWSSPRRLGTRLRITGYDSGTGVISYTYTLLDNETYPDANGQNNIFEDFAVHLTDTDGQFTDATLSVNIIDDVPTAVDDSTTIDEGQQVKSDIVLTIDRSGSMAGIFQQVKDAVEVLFNSGSVNSVFLVSFSSDCHVPRRSRRRLVHGSQRGVRRHRCFHRRWRDRLRRRNRGGDHQLHRSASRRQQACLMYLSDGEPNETNGTGSNGIDEDDTDVGGIGEETAWINFLTTNGFDESLAFGFGGLRSRGRRRARAHRLDGPRRNRRQSVRRG